MQNFKKLVGLSICCGVLTACGQISGNDVEATADQLKPSKLTPPSAIANLIQSRMVNQDVLFAEVILRYEGVEETETASRQVGSDVWPVEFRLPSGRNFSLEVTWFDTADGERLNLVNFNRNFNAVFDSGPMNFNFSNYDFDGYDVDNDGMTNLAEREAGTSPTIGNLGCPIVPQAQSNLNNEPNLTYESQIRFTDDFEFGLPRYSINTRSLGSSDDGLVIEGIGNIQLSVTGAAGQQDGSSQVKFVPTLSDDPDSIFVRMQMLPESTEVDSADNSTDSRFGMFARLFNSLATGGVNDPSVHDQTGEVDLSMEVRNYQEGGFSDFLQCARVRNADGSRSFFIDVTEDGDNDGCARIQTLPRSIEPGREYLLGMGVDRQAQTIFFQIDEDRVEVPSTLPMFAAKRPFLDAGVSAFGEGVHSSVRVSEITTNGFVDSQLSDLDPAIAGRYSNINQHLGDPSRNVSGENGQLRLEGISADQNAVRTDLFIEGNTDYVSADLVLSSESQVLSSDGFATVRITGAQYNDLANGGVNRNEGDNWASLGISVDSAGELGAFACLIRSQTTDYESTCSVTETPESVCPRFDLPVQFDTAYKASISLDRENKRLVYQLNDEQIVHEITSNLFLPAGGSKAANTRISAEGRVVGLVDNLSTIPPQ